MMINSLVIGPSSPEPVYCVPARCMYVCRSSVAWCRHHQRIVWTVTALLSFLLLLILSHFFNLTPPYHQPAGHGPNYQRFFNKAPPPSLFESPPSSLTLASVSHHPASSSSSLHKSTEGVASSKITAGAHKHRLHAVFSSSAFSTIAVAEDSAVYDVPAPASSSSSSSPSRSSLSVTPHTGSDLLSTSSSSSSSSGISSNSPIHGSPYSPSSMLIVTACSANHFHSLQYMLYSLRSAHAPVLLYDLGLTVEQRHSLLEFPTLSVRHFPYHLYPSHVNVRVNAGEYAWKPIIIEQVLSEGGWPLVLWLDAGAYVLDLPLIERRLNNSQHIYVGPSSGVISDRTHFGMFEYLGESMEAYAQFGNVEAGMIGFRNTEFVRQHIVKPWSDCAQHKECIAPTGSSRLNHRQDQSVLSYLVAKTGVEIARTRASELDGVRTKCDRGFYHWLPLYPTLDTYAHLCLAD